jgi:cytochrome c-type biogenesis protein
MLNIFPKQLKFRPIPRVALVGLVALVAIVLVILTGGDSTGTGQAVGGLGGQPLAILAMLAFVGGVVSFASPCTLPILPAYFAFASQSGRSRIAANTVAFMLGVALMFSLLGASASALGRLVIQSQELLLLIGGAIVLVFGVMSLLGKGFTGVSSEQTAGNGPASNGPNNGARGSFVFGLTFSLGWSSCVGPILGVVLTLAASSGNVARGMLLLFIYAIGLGLPLIIVSTFFGRASRKSLFWRALKGKGWFVNSHLIIVAVLWALAAWRVLVAFSRYGFENLNFFAGQEFTLTHEIGILLIALAGAALWTFSKTGERRINLQLHSTQLFSGVLFIFMAILMLNGTLAEFNALIPVDLAIWFSVVEDQLIGIFG